MEKIETFIDRLQEEKRELYKKKAFMIEHKFEKESDFIQTKINVMQEVIDGLDCFKGGKMVYDIKFNFDRLQ